MRQVFDLAAAINLRYRALVLLAAWPLHHGNFRRRVWLPAVAAAGLPGIHLHDLRHAGSTFTANAGPTCVS